MGDFVISVLCWSSVCAVVVCDGAIDDVDANVGAGAMVGVLIVGV